MDETTLLQYNIKPNIYVGPADYKGGRKWCQKEKL